MRPVTDKEHGAAQWLLDALRSGAIRPDQFRMDITCSRDHTEDRTIAACVGGWMYLYMNGITEKASADDVRHAQTYVHNEGCQRCSVRTWLTEAEESPLARLFFPPCGTRQVTRDNVIVALRTFLATGEPLWPAGYPHQIADSVHA